MSQVYPPYDLNTMQGDQLFDLFNTRTDTLRSNFAGDDEPVAPLIGQTWFETDTLIYYVWNGTAWIVIGSEIASNIDFQLNQALNLRLENLAADVAPAAGSEGLVYLHTGAGKAKLLASDTVRETFVSLSNADLDSIPLPLESWKFGATPPTDPGDVGPFPVLLFDAVAESIKLSVPIPRGFSTDASVILRVHYLLNAAETAGDVADVALDYRKLILESGDLATGALTSVTAVSANPLTGGNLAQHTYHTVDIPMAFNDATNPLTPNVMLGLEFSMNALGGAGELSALLFLRAELLSPVGVLGITEVA